MLTNETMIEWNRQPVGYRYIRESTAEPTGPGVENLGKSNQRYFFLVHTDAKYLDGIDLPARDLGGTIIVPPPIARQPSQYGWDESWEGQPQRAAWFRDKFLGIGDFGRKDDPFAGWLRPEILEAERAVKFFRNERIYGYVHETLLMDTDHGREIDPHRELEAAEILGIGQYDHRYRGPRRVWFLSHSLERLDGIDPPCDCPAGGVMVAVHPKETTIRAGAYSPIYVPTDRQFSEAEILEAKRHRGAALALWAADKVENERRREVRRDFLERKAADARRVNPYKG